MTALNREYYSALMASGRAAADLDALAEAGLDVRNAFNFAPGTHDSPVNSLGPAPNVSHRAWEDWQFDAAVIIGFSALVAAFGNVPALYIADGHHRAASAARARDHFKGAGESSTFLGVAFPHDQVQVLAYNRVVKDLGSLTPAAFEQAVRDRFDVQDGPATPARRGEIAMYFAGKWQTLRPRVTPESGVRLNQQRRCTCHS